MIGTVELREGLQRCNGKCCTYKNIFSYDEQHLQNGLQ